MRTIITGALALSLLFTADAQAEDEKRPVVKVATVAPKGTPWSALMDRFKARSIKLVKENGKLGRPKFKIYYGGKLGGEKETIRETRAGRVQMWGGSTAALSTIVPELYAIEAPFLFETSEEADFVLDNYAKPHVTKLLADKDFVFYQWAENGWHGLATKDRCITGIKDLQGLRIRSQEAQIHLDSLNAMGASAVEMAVPEVLQALQTGKVEGFSNTPLFSFATSWYQGIGFFTTTRHMYQPALIVYSKKWFDEQPKEMQAILLAEAEGDQKFGRDGVRGIRDGLLENFKKANKTVCEMTEPQRDELKKATATIFDKYRKKYTKRGKPLFDSIIAGKKAWAAKAK